MFTAASYVSFDGLSFEKSSPDDAIIVFGNPISDKMTRRGARELTYAQFILRFVNSALVECTLLPYADAQINEKRVTWNEQFLRELCSVEPNPRDAFGFIIFPSLGVAVTGIHDHDEAQLAITLFSRSYLEGYLDGSVAFVADDID